MWWVIPKPDSPRPAGNNGDGKDANPCKTRRHIFFPYRLIHPEKLKNRNATTGEQHHALKCDQYAVTAPV